MARRRSYTLFFVLNVVISLGVAVLAITVYSQTQTEEERPRALPTLLVYVTATLDPLLPPAAALQSTVDAQAGTIVALEREIASIPSAGAPIESSASQPDNQDASPTTQRQDSQLPTLDPSLIPPLPSLSSGAGGQEVASVTGQAFEDGCIRYTVSAGDTASKIATDHGVGLSPLLVLNGINDQTVLQIGDVLLIPSPECVPEATPTITPTARPTFNLTFVAPTATLPAVTGDSDVELVQVLNAGDVTTEQVEIRNNGGQINLMGWKLSDSDGNIYIFPEVRLVPGSVIRVLTRTGTNTPGFLYWNLNTGVWQDGEIATLSNAADEPQSVINIGAEVIEFATTTP